VSSLASGNKYIHRLHKLCLTLVELCKPLVEAASSSGTVPSSRSGEHAETQQPRANALPINNSIPLVPSSSGNTTNFGFANFPLPAVIEGEGPWDPELGNSSWDSNMMWQLFASQPTLDWFSADILNGV
jgi:hypothetical protein